MKQIVISTKTILITFLILLGAYVLYRSGPILGLLFIAVLIVISVEPLVKSVMKVTLLNKPVSRGLAVLVTYASLVLFTTVMLTAWLPIVIVQLQRLLVYIVGLLIQYDLPRTFEMSLAEILPEVSKISGGFLLAVMGSFRALASIFSVFVLAIYMSSDWENIKERVAGLFSDRVSEDILGAVDEIEVELGHWVKGQLFLMFVVGLMSYIGLIALGIEYPLALALFSGLLEVVPLLGPFIAGAIVGTIGFLAVPLKGVGIVVVFVIIQQLENNILVPMVMKKVSGFSPIIILLVLLIAGEFFGVMGAILAVPATMITTIVLRRVLAYTD